MTFFTKKPTLVLPIVDDSKIIDENTDDLKFTVPAVQEAVTPLSSSDIENPLKLQESKLARITSFLQMSKEAQTPSVPTQMPTALEFLAQQRSVDMATGIDTQHLGADKNEEKQDVKPLVYQEDLD